MKKLSLYVFLVLILLAGCSNEKETSLENCADYTYLEYTKNKIYLIEKVAFASWEYADLKEKAKKAYIEDNKNWKKLKKYESQETKDKAERKRLSDIWQASYNAKKLTQSAVDEFEIKTSSKALQSLNFDDKIKINYYYTRYRTCEKEYQNTPTAFTKRWKK